MAIKFPKIPLTDNVKGVLIDLDNTIYDFVTAEEHTLKQCHINFDKMGKLSWDDFLSQYHIARMTIALRLSPQSASRSRYHAFLDWLESEGVRNAHIYASDYEEYYWKVLIDSISIAPDAEKFINRAIKQNISIAVVTNMQPQIQARKLEKLGIATKIDYLVTSEGAGAEKPSPLPFKLALEKMHLTASDVIMVGDHPQHDIIGAESLGIKSYLVKADKNNY